VEIFFYRNKRWKFVYWHFRRKSPVIDKEYDIAIDYQGLGSAILPMAVVLDKTKVQKRYSWIHSDISAIPKSMLELAFLLAHFDKIVCVSKAAQNELLKLYPKFQTKVCVLYNIIPKNEIISLSQCCIDYTPKTGQTSILTVGRLEKTKGYDVALNSLYLLKQNDIDFRYIIVGDGSQRTELEKLSKKLSLENNVFFVGKTTNPYPYYRIADIYLQPSRFEGYCITLAEARLFHLPIVTTDFAGAREQIIPNCTGVIVACDSREIAEQLMILCKDKNKCDRFSKELIENEKNVSYSEKINDLLQVDDGV
jgi:glycosyltransferase involved in cell wall biosynthesis